MTYVLAINVPNANFIISDMRVSWSRHSGENVALKTGLLFPGCIFGRVGNAIQSGTFISAFKRAYNRTPTIEEAWLDFEKFIQSYDFPKTNEEQFQLVLSARHSGQPKLYTLDSQKGLIPCSSRWTSLGSGKKALDQFVARDLIPETDRLIYGNDLRRDVWAFVACLRLIERSEGMERSMLESLGVGGIFHFVSQTSDVDIAQDPALYVLSVGNRCNKTITQWMYRVSYVRGALVVHKLIPPGQLRDYPEGKHDWEYFLDEASTPYVRDFGTDGIPRYLVDELKREEAAQPFYLFCGFGFPDPAFRGRIGIHAGPKNEQYVVNPKTGEIDPEFWRKTVENFEPSIL